METKTYDAKDVSVIVDGVYLTGFGEDMVEVAKAENNYEVKVGAQGDTTRSKINNKTGTIKVTLLQSSPQVPYLDILANSGKLVPITVIYAGEPKEISSATEAFVQKPADRKYKSSGEDREYEFQCLDLSM
ncbi:phage protein [Paenibacillus sp. 32352]|uniref:phage structural protein n=1 Tax=Paenibacillus sp. 32352 TaxID=1969111 RepID=UPI0009AC9CCA|nr:phage protein [Paenibacillus sp. 32352]